MVQITSPIRKTHHQRSSVVALKASGLSYREISSQLRIPHTTVAHIWNYYKVTDDVGDRLRKGRPAIFTNKGERNTI